MASYTANKTAFLTSNKQTVAIETLEQLSESKDYKPMVYKGTNAEDLFKLSNNSVKKKIWEKILVDKTLYSNNESVYDVLKNKNYVQIGEYSLLKYYSSRYCDLDISSESFDSTYFGT